MLHNGNWDREGKRAAVKDSSFPLGCMGRLNRGRAVLEQGQFRALEKLVGRLLLLDQGLDRSRVQHGLKDQDGLRVVISDLNSIQPAHQMNVAGE